MQAYLGGQAVTAEIALVDTDGNAIVASAINYRVVNQAEVELVPSTALTSFTAGDPNAVVVVSGLNNTLTAGAARELRIIELILTTVEGTIKLSYNYFIEADELLTEGVNSFQNYGTALLGAYDIPDMEGWNNASKPDRMAGMIQARANMGALRFRYVFDFFQNIVEPSFGVRDITLLTPTEWAALPITFKDALRKAQLLEANSLLGGDPASDVRRSGIVSKRVGESSDTFRQTKPLELVVCRRAYMALAKYITNRVRVARSGGPITDSSPYSGMF